MPISGRGEAHKSICSKHLRPHIYFIPLDTPLDPCYTTSMNTETIDPDPEEEEQEKDVTPEEESTNGDLNKEQIIQLMLDIFGE